jgi:ADP-ribose pyrophosphatase YjhB (NUDIX family)
MGYKGSYVWKLRQVAGTRPLLVPGVALVVLDERDRVLLQRRDDDGEWATPGGAADEGDSFTAAALRELSEECGLDVAPCDLRAFATLSDPSDQRLTYPDGGVVYGFALCLEVTRWEGRPRARDGESLELRFFPLDRLPGDLSRPSSRTLELFDASRRTHLFQVA